MTNTDQSIRDFQARLETIQAESARDVDAWIAMNRETVERQAAERRAMENRDVFKWFVWTLVGVVVVALLWFAPFAHAQTTQAVTGIESPLPAWATFCVSFIGGVVAVLTAVKLVLLPLVKSMVGEAKGIAEEARAIGIRNTDRTIAAHVEAAKALGVAESASGTADKALAQTMPTTEEPQRGQT